MRQYWVFKSEPNKFSITDLANMGKAPWDGVRNFQARNFLRDKCTVGDKVLFYHSSCAEPGIVGIAKVVRAGYPDLSAQDKRGKYFDVRSTKETPLWYAVDIMHEKTFPEPILLARLKTLPALVNCRLMQKGNRLSVFPVTEAEFGAIVSLVVNKKVASE